MNIKPLQNRLIVKQHEANNVTESGIIIPEGGQDKPLEGTVISVGEGLTLPNGVVTEMDVKEGDHVLFEKYKGTSTNIEGEDYLILRESDIIGVVEE